jgi:ectoine hydroxylase
VEMSALRPLSAEERESFERAGYLVVAGALDPDLVERLLALARAQDENYRERPGVTPYHTLNAHDLIALDEAWLELVDLPSTFPKVVELLGWNIQVFHTQLLVTPPAPPGAHAGAYGWHQDNNRMNLDLDCSPQPRISLKVGYFLTDVTHAGMANLCVVPGSHQRGRPDLGFGEQPEGAEELIAAAGDAVVFDRRLWHAASTNTSDTTRVFVTVGYAHRWVRPKSAMQHADLVERVDPVRRQLLGWSSSPNGWFDPTDDDVPLRAWVRHHFGDGAVAP